MKKSLLIIICIFYFNWFYSQEIPKVFPPSPNASSLGSYGQVSVGLFTGTPQLEIPLYYFKEGKLNVPISLNYSSNGIRVDEIASIVGMGWNLIADGVISRTINDDPDESVLIPLPTNFPGAMNQDVLDYLTNSLDTGDGYVLNPIFIPSISMVFLENFTLIATDCPF